MQMSHGILEEELHQFIAQKGYPCVGSRTALNKQQVFSHQYDDLCDERNNLDILNDLYAFVDRFDLDSMMYSSFVCMFDEPRHLSEVEFERALWQKLQQLHDIDSGLYEWDSRVSDNPENGDFSFSLGGKAFFVIGLNPGSKRKSRCLGFPAIVFNLHEQFDKLKQEKKFEPLKQHIRKNDVAFSGGKNVMLNDHGDSSEARQYSGRKLESDWQCPFKKRKPNA